MGVSGDEVCLGSEMITTEDRVLGKLANRLLLRFWIPDVMSVRNCA